MKARKLCSEPYKLSAVRCEISCAVGSPMFVRDLCPCVWGWASTDRCSATVCVCVCVCARQLYLLEECTQECRCYSGVITGVVPSSWCANYRVALFSPQTRSVAPWIFSELANRIEWSAEQTHYLAFISDHFDPFVFQREFLMCSKSSEALTGNEACAF